ncbi:MAG: glycosyltransferase family 9 protein [Pyrinomonadaceae bacterium]
MNLKSYLYALQFRVRQRLIARSYKLRKADGTGDRPELKDPEKILFVLTGLIGDSIMSMPAIKESRRLWPNAHIVVLGKKHNHDLLAASTFVDEFIVSDADPLSVRRADEIADLQKRIERGRFDTAVILLGDHYARLLADAKIPVRIGVAGTLLEPFLTHIYDIGSARTWSINERLNSIRLLSPNVKPGAPEVRIGAKDQDAALKKLQDLGLRSGERYAVLHPYGSTPRQWWDIENVEPLARHLAEKQALRCVVVGKSYDLNGVEVEPELPSDISSGIINTIGRLSLPELMAAIDNADLTISTDSGPFHIAGAMGKPVIGLFRSSRPEHAGAYKTATTLLGTDENCAGNCSWDHCRTVPCRQMQNIDVKDVIETVDEILSK